MVIVSLGPGARSYHKLASCPHAKRIQHRKSIPEGEAIHQGYCRCSYCGGMRYYLYNFNLYLGCANLDGKLSCSYDKNYDGVCIRSKAGFWRVTMNEKTNLLELYHLSAFDPELPDERLMTRGFHRQKDMSETSQFGSLLHYIWRHDRDKIMYGNDWRKMPKSTKQQRRFAKQAKKRERKKSIRNVYKIIDKISAGQI